MSSTVPTAGWFAAPTTPAATGTVPSARACARADWLAERQAELLPVPYFHVVFTLPAPAADIAFQNKAVVYAILFRAATETLRSVAADTRYLGAEFGTIAVLHTPDQVRGGSGDRRCTSTLTQNTWHYHLLDFW